MKNVVLFLRKNLQTVINSMRIGVEGDALSLQRARHLQAALSTQEIPSEIVFIPDQTALLRGDVDVLTADMASLPAFLPDGWKISAVSGRKDPAESLVVKSSVIMDPGRLFGLPEGLLVECASPLQAGQLRIFRPDLELVVTALRQMPDLFDNASCTARVVPAHFLDSLSPDPGVWKVIRLHPQEIVPPPGQGVMAWIASADDLPIRRLLRRVHHPEVSAVTNVERMALRLLAPGTYEAFGAYCSQDKIGNFHVHGILFPLDGSGPKRFNLSSSTSFRLAERLIAGLA